MTIALLLCNDIKIGLALNDDDHDHYSDDLHNDFSHTSDLGMIFCNEEKFLLLVCFDKVWFASNPFWSTLVYFDLLRSPLVYFDLLRSTLVYFNLL